MKRSGAGSQAPTRRVRSQLIASMEGQIAGWWGSRNCSSSAGRSTLRSAQITGVQKEILELEGFASVTVFLKKAVDEWAVKAYKSDGNHNTRFLTAG